MEAWQAAGTRVKGDWAGMLKAAASRSDAKVKLPFVPLEVSGRALAAVLEDLLPALLGPNPSLLTVIERGGRAIKAYAEDASRGVYERLVRLDTPEGAPVADILRAASGAGVEIGVVKRADVGFFDVFAEEPADILDALALFISGVSAAVRDGTMVLSPEPAAATLLSKIALERDTVRLMLSRLLPEGSYGLGLVCTRGVAALVIEVSEERWSVREVSLAARSPGAASRELVDGHGCAVAAGISLPDVRGLMGGELGLPEFLRRRGGAWAVATRSGAESLLDTLGALVRFLNLEPELLECNIGLESVLALLGGYLDAAREYARTRGVGIRVTDGAKAVSLLWDSRGLREESSPEPLEVDWSVVRGAISTLAADPIGRLGGLVPRSIVDHAGYETAVALIECSRPRGARLVVYGGPHRFFNAAWEGDACAVLLDGRGGARVVELPTRPLEIEKQGSRVQLADGRLDIDLAFRRERTNRRIHGAGRHLAEGGPSDWLPGLEVERGLYRLVSGRARFDREDLVLAGGWMLLERGEGRLLRWPFGATWHYASWLFPDGTAGAGVRVAPMLAESTPLWLRKFMESGIDGAVELSPGADGPVDFRPAIEPGGRVRLVRDSCGAGERELTYEVLSCAVVPFDEEGQVIFRMRCLCAGGAGLVEIPATFPAYEGGAEECAVSFTDEAVSLQAGGRELLLVERGGSGFLAPYVPAAPGLIRRAARRLIGRASP